MGLILGGAWARLGSGDVKVVGAGNGLRLPELQALATGIQPHKDHAVALGVDAAAKLGKQGLQFGHAQPALIEGLLPAECVVLYVAQRVPTPRVFSDVVADEEQVPCVHARQCLADVRRVAVWQACRRCDMSGLAGPGPLEEPARRSLSLSGGLDGAKLIAAQPHDGFFTDVYLLAELQQALELV